MKKISILTLAILCGLAVQSQSLKDLKTEYGLTFYSKDYGKFIASATKFLSDEKNKNVADAWYMKGYMLNLVSGTDKAAASCTDCLGDALNAFMKVYEIDPGNKMAAEDQHINMFDLYGKYFDKAIEAYRKEDYAGAFDLFSKAVTIQRFVHKNGFTYTDPTTKVVTKYNDLDTNLIMNTGLAALNAKKGNEAIPYFSELVNAGVSGDNYLVIYENLAEIYANNKDYARLTPLLDKCISLYPTDDFFYSLLTKDVDKTDKKALLDRYEMLSAKYANVYQIHYFYAAELFNYIYKTEPKPADYEALKTKLTAVLTKADGFGKNSDAAIVMIKHLYNAAYDANDAALRIKGVKPDDQKKKKDLMLQADKLMTEAAPFGDKAIAELKNVKKLNNIQEDNFRTVVDLMMEIYKFKKNPAKAAEYQKIKTEFAL